MRLLEEERARWYTEGRKDGERLGRMQERRAECGEVDQGSTDESDGAMTGITRVLGEGDRTRAPCTGAPGTVIGSIAYTDELSLGGEFFNGDAGAYEQREFVEPSVAENPHWRQGDPVILAAARKPTTHFIWSVEEYNTPIPLGRYGQPHLESSAWEDFNPIRLWKEVGGSKVERGDSFWVRLALDAWRLPFEFRSNAQRIIVSEAHRFKAAGSTRFVLPLDGEVPEVDIWHQCVNNALYMPLAVRRQYSFDPKTKALYREWDAGDLGIYLTMRALWHARSARWSYEEPVWEEEDR
ncbi:hypothetical protein AURDEDRAFT_178120 [Auricularia subglabra TFB-10046 SS5]|uniref:Uncharacterized protein n=1 Tax=Auricularia subglabra (strain TFB-10046 / SS5) TaxID=717982 RepID=J0WKF0_AURST|nr:hypothetical protein AURDEDRAFT_178120 [Auricularia subglabra TFB-10046 SS5]